MATSARIGYGNALALSTDGSTWVTLAEVRNFNPPSANIELIDATNMDSPNRYREKVQGFIEGGEMNVEMNFIPGSTTDQTIRAMINAGDAIYCRITYTESVVWTFLGQIRTYEISSPTDDIMTATLVIEQSASLTIS
jgi:predicted secreted protein